MRVLAFAKHPRVRIALLIAAAILAGPILLAFMLARASDARR